MWGTSYMCQRIILIWFTFHQGQNICKTFNKCLIVVPTRTYMCSNFNVYVLKYKYKLFTILPIIIQDLPDVFLFLYLRRRYKVFYAKPHFHLRFCDTRREIGAKKKNFFFILPPIENKEKNNFFFFLCFTLEERKLHKSKKKFFFYSYDRLVTACTEKLVMLYCCRT